MLDKKVFKLSEMIILFIGLPPVLVSSLNLFYTVGIVLLGLIYCVWQLKSRLGFSKSTLWAVNWSDLWPAISLRFLLFVVVTSLFVVYQSPDDFFVVVVQYPFMWIGISIFYIFVSTLPQEIIYRAYFFSRYSDLTNNKWLFIILNASVFCFAHIILMDNLVFLLTFCGGVLFAITYDKSKSLVLTVAEHSLYGVWLFTVGMGEMLYFPIP